MDEVSRLQDENAELRRLLQLAQSAERVAQRRADYMATEQAKLGALDGYRRVP